MKLKRNEMQTIIDDLSQCERRDNVTISRSDYNPASREMARERQEAREPLLTKLRLIASTAGELSTS